MHTHRHREAELKRQASAYLEAIAGRIDAGRRARAIATTPLPRLLDGRRRRPELELTAAELVGEHRGTGYAS